MPCERCGSYNEECICAMRAERLAELEMLGHIVVTSQRLEYVLDASSGCIMRAYGGTPIGAETTKD